MRVRRISATEAARNFSDVIGQVRYQATAFDIVKGKEVVARIVPSTPSGGMSLVELQELWADGPHLAPDDVEAFARDIAEARAQLTLRDDDWGS
jgi:hypothetical protein